MKRLILLFFFLVFVSCFQSVRKPVDYVNPFIGTSNSGNTFPGAVLPFGMVSVGPHTETDSCRSGYISGRPYFYGFGHVHLSGTGCPELGNIILAPTTGNVKHDTSGYRSTYARQSAMPGFFETNLTSFNIHAEMTATIHTSLNRYTFPECDGDANILLDVSQRFSWNRDRDGYARIISPTEVEGWSLSGDFCNTGNRQLVYFVAQFNKGATSFGTWTDDSLTADLETTGSQIGAYFRFQTKPSEEILVKVGISYVSIENARLNLNVEQPGWDFKSIRQNAYKAWNDELSRIDVKGGTEAQRTIFYTGLYHVMMHPNLFCDVNGEYPAMGSKEILNSNGHKRYTVFSLWDTYRTVHPLLTLVYPDRQLDMIHSMVSMVRENGWLPKWELASSETYVMVGDPAVPVITDTYLKGLTGFDVETAYEAMKNSADDVDENPIRPGLQSYLSYGYIPMEDPGSKDVWGSVSTTLEYNFADWNLAQLAKSLGHAQDYDRYMARSRFYRNLYDSDTGFLRPRYTDGTWLTPFDPVFTNEWPGSPGYVEGSAWHYSFFVNHDIPGLAKLMGGNESFLKKLDQCFEEDLFVLWNEPDMAYPYLYTYFQGHEWKTQKIVRESIYKHFRTGPDGIPGNDDTGTLSAWYVFSAMGLYPVCPGNPEYRLGSPIFDTIQIHLNQKHYPGEVFTIRTKNASEKNRYIQSMQLNGNPYPNYYLQHKDIVAGGELVLKMGSQPVQN
ncbi:glycoside hydrolase family 92 protein [candidate division KSB1 bacterium]|nr:glycoside hydrolase family 92 protein [candidate division KSB1 bacterium]